MAKKENLFALKKKSLAILLHWCNHIHIRIKIESMSRARCNSSYSYADKSYLFQLSVLFGLLVVQNTNKMQDEPHVVKDSYKSI